MADEVDEGSATEQMAGQLTSSVSPADDATPSWLVQLLQTITETIADPAELATPVIEVVLLPATIVLILLILRVVAGYLWPRILPLLGRIPVVGRLSSLALLIYRRRVEDSCGTVTNIYLDRREELDLNQVFVPLTLRSHSAGGSAQLVRRTSRQILTDAGQRRLVILGDPGSGKTTLLKAIAAGVSRKQWPELEQLVPVFVTLRAYADKADDTLFDYMAAEVLPGLGLPLAEPILKRLLAKHRLLLLLDGLDEVNEDHLDIVGKQIKAFFDDDDPKQRCRVFVTCREQNYAQLTDPDLFRRLGFAEYRLGELSDNEIEQMVAKRTADFTAQKKSPAAFIDAVRAQEQVRHLLRNPLLLTLSIALYLYQPREGVPQTLAAFYEEGIEHLLRRHDFPERRDVAKRNRFRFQDKFELLRRFALGQMVEATTENRDFGDFRLERMIAEAKALAQQSLAIQANEADDLVKEIHQNAGLIVTAGAGDLYAFAHRSFHEFCAAQQLARLGEEGFHVLKQHLKQPAWRQATLFYASIDHPQAEKLVENLLERSQSSPDLLSLTADGAALLTTPLVALRRRVIKKLVNCIRTDEGDARRSLFVALINLGRDAPKDIQTRVNDELADLLALEQPAQLARELGRLDAQTAIALLDILATSDDPERRRAGLEGLAQFDTLDKIDPLWRLLASFEEAGDHEGSAAARSQLFELLERGSVAVSRLNGQPAWLADRLADEEVQRAYPFMPASEAPSNLACLLTLEARGQHSDGVGSSTPRLLPGKSDWPTEPSQTWRRFLDAATQPKAADMLRSWCSLPKDLARWSLAVPWQWLGRTWFAFGAALGCFATASFLLFRDWPNLHGLIFMFALVIGAVALTSFLRQLWCRLGQHVGWIDQFGCLPRAIRGPFARLGGVRLFGFFLLAAPLALFVANPTSYEGHEGFVRSAAFSPDGAKVVTASFDDTARLWEADSGKPLATLQGHEGLVRSAAFSPDGGKVVTASSDGTARLWEAAEAEMIWTSQIPFWGEGTLGLRHLGAWLLLVVLFLFVPTLKIFDPGRMLYLPKPNRYIRLFDMPGIEQWLPPGFLDQRKRRGRVVQVNIAIESTSHLAASPTVQHGLSEDPSPDYAPPPADTSRKANDPAP